MIEDLSKTIKAQLYERARSPLFASFALSWLAWNYRFVTVLFSSMTAPEKFRYIDQSLYSCWMDVVSTGLIFPLLTTAFLIFVYPFPAKYVYEFWRNRQRELKEIKQKIEDETPLTREESRTILRDAHKISSDYEQEIARLSAEITRQRELIEDLELQLNPREKVLESNKPLSATESPLEFLQSIMLQRIVESPTPYTVKNLFSQSGSDQLNFDYNLDELERRNFIEKFYSNAEAEDCIKATPLGRKYIVESRK